MSQKQREELSLYIMDGALNMDATRGLWDLTQRKKLALQLKKRINASVKNVGATHDKRREKKRSGT